MTLQQAQELLVAITSAGFEARAVPLGDGAWIVLGHSSQPDIPAAAAADFAVQHGVQAFLSDVQFR